MASITGTEGADTLKGTADIIDTIQGLGGDDLIIGSGGNDSIDGGAGNNTIDYSKSIGNIRLKLAYLLDGKSTIEKNFRGNTGSPLEDRIVNIKTINGPITQIYDDLNGNPVVSPSSNIVEAGIFGSIEADLSKNQLTYSSLRGIETFSINNFVGVVANFDKSRLTGDNSNNLFDTARSKDAIIFASKGNDTYYVSATTVLDYSKLNRPETLQLAAYSKPSSGGNYDIFFLTENIKKSDFGVDTVYPAFTSDSFSKIIGAVNQANTVDVSGPENILASLDINLANNSLKINGPNVNGERGFTNAQIEIVNFVNVIGSKNNDKIVGGNKNSKLTGGGGNDTITGGSKNDRITGSDSTARGVGECDTLTGGGGRDKFVLGDKNGAYYVGKGSNDYATITDFDLFKDSICIGSLKDYSFAIQGTNEVDLYSGKDVKTRDLIAKIHITSGISAGNRNSRSIAGSNPNLDAIVAKIDIIAGTNS
jgi:Ca2+-binding RTX toxin-like protein